MVSGIPRAVWLIYSSHTQNAGLWSLLTPTPRADHIPGWKDKVWFYVIDSILRFSIDGLIISIILLWQVIAQLTDADGQKNSYFERSVFYVIGWHLEIGRYTCSRRLHTLNCTYLLLLFITHVQSWISLIKQIHYMAECQVKIVHNKRAASKHCTAICMCIQVQV